jgi:hypothetical protein
MHVSSFIRTIALGVLSLGFIQCMTAPHDGDTVTTTNGTRHFEGWVPAAGVAVTLNVKKTTTTTHSCGDAFVWEAVTTVNAATTSPLNDDCGGHWYKWQADIPLKNGTPYWCSQAHFGYQTEYQAVSGGIALAAFPVGVENTCHPSKNCGSNVINECSNGLTSSRLFCFLNNGCTPAF